MTKKQFTRPTTEFTVTSLAWLRDSVARHVAAGFEIVPDNIVRRRLHQLVEFLQNNAMLTSTMVSTQSDLRDDFSLKNSDLTDQGYYFLQRYIDKWYDRLHKDKGDDHEMRFLVKWYTQFLSERKANSAQHCV